MPDKIGHYTIVSQLGRGGMGVVYKGHEESLNRFVAIKVLGEHLVSDGDFLTRFIREARAAAGLSHPNVIQIYFIGEDQGRHYFAMEYVAGRSVQSIIKEEGRIGNPRAAQLILQAAHGLAAAHDQGVLHRDIKPANLMLDDRGVLKIADFGLALPVEAQTRLTATGMLMGTPGYLSPEHCLGQQVDHRADIYALGVTYYEMLTGLMPFRGESPLALLRAILQEEPPDVLQLNPDVDAEARRILMHMIAKDRDQRYQNCHELVADLEEYLAARGVRSVTAGLGTRGGAAKTPRAAAEAPTRVDARVAAADAPTRMDGAPTVREAAASLPRTGSSPAATTRLEGAATVREPVAPTTERLVDPSRATAARTPTPSALGSPTVQQREAPTLRTPSPSEIGSPTLVPVAASPQAIAPVASAAAAGAPTPARSFSKVLAIAAVLVVLVGGGVGAFVIFKVLGGRDVGGTKTTQASMLPAQARIGAGANAAGSEPIISSSPTTPATDTMFQQPGVELSTKTDLRILQQEPVRDRAADVRREPAAVEPRESRLPQRRADSERPAVRKPERAVPGLSGVAVVVGGDPALDSAVAAVVSSEIEAAGLQLADAEELSANAPSRRLLDQLRREGVAVLVLARIEPTGQRTLHYMGRADTAYGARIILTVHDVATGQMIGQRQSATLEYTQLTVDRVAEKALGRLARKAVEAIQSR